MKQVHFPLRVQFTLNKVDGKIIIQSGKVKYNVSMEEYPDIPPIKLVRKLAFKDGELDTSLALCKNLLKSHMAKDHAGVEDDVL